MNKQLEENSKYAHLDLDGDGIVDDEEMAMERNILEMEELRLIWRTMTRNKTRKDIWHGLPSLECYYIHLQLYLQSG